MRGLFRTSGGNAGSLRANAVILGMLVTMIWHSFATPGIGEEPTPSAALRLTLDDCVRLGVAGNLGLLKSRLEREGASYGVPIARKIFVPTANALIQESEEGRRTRTWRQSVSARGKSGTRVSLTNEIKDLQGRPAKDENVQTFSLTQPLMKNFGARVTGYEIDLSRLDERIAVAKFRSDLNSFIFDVCNLYFQLCLARRTLGIQEQALSRARKQFEDTRHDIELGAIPEREIFLVEENLVDFQVRVENARHDIVQLELQLGRILDLDPALNTGFTVEELLDDDRFHDTATPPANPGSLVGDNPDLAMDRLLLEKSVTTLEYQKVQSKPQLDLFFDYRMREGAGAPRPNSSVMGIEYQVPISREPDRALVDQNRIKVDLRRLSIRDSERRLAFEMMGVFQKIRHFEEVLKSKKRVVELSRKKLEAETEKYRNGFSTLADVVRFQRELENSLIDEAGSLLSLQQNRLREFLLSGSLPGRFGIVIGE